LNKAQRGENTLRAGKEKGKKKKKEQYTKRKRRGRIEVKGLQREGSICDDRGRQKSDEKRSATRENA